MVLLWGAHAVRSHDISSFQEMVAEAGTLTVTEGFGQRGDRVVIVAGVPFGMAGTTNNLRVVEIE